MDSIRGKNHFHILMARLKHLGKWFPSTKKKISNHHIGLGSLRFHKIASIRNQWKGSIPKLSKSSKPILNK